MSEIMKERLKDSIGKKVLIFLKNDFRFEGKIINCDDEYLEILDFKSGAYKIFGLLEIKECEVKNG